MAEVDLTEFLEARIAEDEAVAREADAEHPEHRTGFPRSTHVVYGLESRGFGNGYQGFALVFDPARVLAECEAKRRMIDGIAGWLERGCAPWNADYLRLMALPYADHPDFREDWRP